MNALLYFFNSRMVLLMMLAAFQQAFLWFANCDIAHHSITQAHGQVAYHLYKYNSVLLNPELTAHIKAMPESKDRLIELKEVTHLDFGSPTQPFPINDTVGYGVVLGLLWKITHSLQFIDIQWLQILIFILLMPLFYQTALLLFGSEHIAWWSSTAQLLFLPLGAFNIQAVRDVWAYYALLILLYCVLKYLRQGSLCALVMGCIFF